MIVHNSIKKNQDIIPLVAFVLGLLFVIFAYWPLLSPMLDNRLQFAYTDFTTQIGDDSGSVRKDLTFYTFSGGHNNAQTNRFVLFDGLSILSDYITFSDTQLFSALILICLVLGSYGVYRLVGYFRKDKIYAGVWIFLLILFYFMNFWSVERLGHTHIWFTYAVFPLFMAWGLSCIRDRTSIIPYSMLFGAFGFIPHSFMYMFSIHIMLSAWSLLAKNRLRDVLKFSLVPVAIFMLLNAPSLVLVGEVGLAYPIDIGTESFSFLSQHGQLINLFAFSNNWWPQVPEEELYGNLLFRFSSTSFFVLLFLAFALSYEKLKKEEKILGILCLLSVFAVVFMAQGTNNSVLSDIIYSIADMGYSQLLGPFREWSRISLMIPVFIATAMLLGAKEKKHGKLLLGLFAIVLAANTISTPAWKYIDDRYAAVYMTGDFDQIYDEGVGKDSKVVWALGNAWNMDSIRQNGEHVISNYPGIEGLGSPYSSKRVRAMEKSEEILAAWNVNYVFKAEGVSGYEWMDCKKLEQVTLCKSNREPTPFSIYDGNAKVTGYSMIDPTAWDVEIEASEPFVLAFADTYSNLWEARVDGETIRPFVLYDLINGYEINKTGRMVVEMRYGPQENFDAGLIVSALTIVGCLSYMVYRKVRQ